MIRQLATGTLVIFFMFSGTALAGTGDFCPWDLSGDGMVDAFDLAQVLGAWGPNPGHPADFTGNGIVDSFDLAILLGAWGICPEPPTAAVTADPNPVSCNQEVFFDGTGSFHPQAGQNIVLYEWDFDYDGVTFDVEATGSTTTHPYLQLATITAALRVTDDHAVPLSDIATVDVVVDQNQAPVADADGPYVLDQGSALLLDGSGSSDPDAVCGADIVNYDWDLNNDGTVDFSSAMPTLQVSWQDLTQLAPPLAFPADPDSGLPNNTIALTVRDGSGAEAPDTSTLTIYINEPLAALDALPNPAACEQEVILDGSGSFHQHAGHEILRYDWDFGDGQQALDAGPMVMHAYSAFDTYTVTLTVSDDNNPARTDDAMLGVVVDQGNIPPAADAGGPYVGELGGNLLLDASASSDPNGACDSLTGYSWDLNNDGTDDFSSGEPTLLVTWAQLTALVPPLAFPADPVSGLPSNTIQLEVTDTPGAVDANSTQLTIYVNEPVASFTENPNPAACNQEVSFDGSGSFQQHPDYQIVRYDWDFGDGAQAFDAGPLVLHSFDEFDTYTVTLTVRDDNNPAKTDSTMRQVVVDQGNNPPVSDPNGPYIVNEDEDLQLDGSGSSDPDAACGDSLVSFEWDLDNDGQFDDASGESPLVPWSVLESLNLPPDVLGFIFLRVTDTLGGSGTQLAALTIVSDACGEPDGGDCCAQNPSPGCEDEDCCDVVCGADPFCCQGTWDTFCVAEAEALCPTLCGG